MKLRNIVFKYIHRAMSYTQFLVHEDTPDDVINFSIPNEFSGIPKGITIEDDCYMYLTASNNEVFEIPIPKNSTLTMSISRLDTYCRDMENFWACTHKESIN